MPTINFNDLRNREEIKFSKTAPPWRIVSPGISFIGRCKNRNCAAYRKKVISCLGKGVFSMSSVIAYCPMKDCKMNIDPENCGFYKAC
mmetsp:Transcript_21958/g.21657  ORF Transcript_21958/g.21657 Transcript_21958/m.21657 type:complete len:88 (+) Transcript_21958:475-738(+)